MSIQVVTVSNRMPTEPYYHFGAFLKSLEKFGVQPVVLGWNQPWNGLMTKPRLLRQWLRNGQAKADVIIVCDAWDILFAAHPEEVETRYSMMRTAWLTGGSSVERMDGPGLLYFNAEKGCFPRGDLADKFPDPGTPWRYLNSGFMIGDPGTVLMLLEAMRLDDLNNDRDADGNVVNVNDQGWYQVMYCLQPVPILLDTQGALCQTLSGCAPDEFDFSGERIRNVVTGTEPLVFHCNGDAKNLLMPRLMEKLGL